MDERAFYRESPTTKPMTLNCPYCRTSETYDLRWMVRKKLEQIPRGADERDRARFAKFLSYMVLVDDKAVCKNIRCRKRFDVSGIKTMAFIYEPTMRTIFGICALLTSLGSASMYAQIDTVSVWMPKAAGGYLDERQSWWQSWPSAARDHGTFCVSCHTAAPYALSRQALR
jgi:hypothetical protein